MQVKYLGFFFFFFYIQNKYSYSSLRPLYKLNIQCSVEGEPTSVTWYKDNISIDNNPDYQTSNINNQYILTIEETFVEDSAKFTCRVENDTGFSETSAYLSVKGIVPYCLCISVNVIIRPSTFLSNRMRTRTPNQPVGVHENIIRFDGKRRRPLFVVLQGGRQSSADGTVVQR